MARVTIEDCITKVSNRFELVMVAARRARNILSGAELTVERDRDKNPVVALREIAEKTVDVGDLKESIIQDFQKYVEMEEPEEEMVELGASVVVEEQPGKSDADDEIARNMLAAMGGDKDGDGETADSEGSKDSEEPKDKA